MAIHIPAQAGEFAPQDEISFLDLMKPGALDPPSMARGEAGLRLEAALKLVATRVAEYRTALEHSAGPEHLESRLALNVKASIRRNSPALAAILGLS